MNKIINTWMSSDSDCGYAECIGRHLENIRNNLNYKKKKNKFMNIQDIEQTLEKRVPRIVSNSQIQKYASRNIIR